MQLPPALQPRQSAELDSSQSPAATQMPLHLQVGNDFDTQYIPENPDQGCLC